jgi:hypothetical protein
VGAFTRGAGWAKATARIPFGREVVTFSCGYWPSGVLPAGALNGGTNMTFLKTREPVEVETSAETEVEGEIREFVRRDVVGIRRQPESDSELVATNINQLLQRVAGTSVQEIDKLIAELQTLRDTLQSEAARVQREIVEYATLSQAALQSTKIIAESLTHWKKVPDAPSLRD